jgi:hypothetical protein
MMKLISEGGFPVWFVLLFGLSALGSAIRYAQNPQARWLRTTGGLALATLFATLSSTAANLGAVFSALSGQRPGAELSLLGKDGPIILMVGLSESMSTPIIGFALLALVGIFYSAGSLRDRAA